MSRCTRVLASNPVHYSALKIKDKGVEEKHTILRLYTMVDLKFVSENDHSLRAKAESKHALVIEQVQLELLAHVTEMLVI